MNIPTRPPGESKRHALAGINDPAGTVSMANAGPGTWGSQCFIVHEDTALPPNYTICWRVSSGLIIVEEVAEGRVSGGGPDGFPATLIGFVGATVREA